jgi:hypothetical protein
MNWYLAKLVFQIICGTGDHTAQFDEQLRLVHAIDQESALAKAYNLGMESEDEFFNKEQQMVQWKFIAVPEIFQLNSFIHGAEVFSRIDEQPDADRYISMIYNRAMHTKEKAVEKFAEAHSY